MGGGSQIGKGRDILSEKFCNRSRWVEGRRAGPAGLCWGPCAGPGAIASFPVEVKIVQLVLDGVEWRGEDAVALITGPGGEEVRRVLMDDELSVVGKEAYAVPVDKG